MSELKPTIEHLLDPYVLQLIEQLAKNEDRIEMLEHNLRVETEGRDHYHRECIDAAVVIASLERRLAKEGDK